MTIKLWGGIIVCLFALLPGLFAQELTQLAAFPTNVGTYSGNSPAYKDHPDLTCSPSKSVDSIMCVSGESVDLYTKSGKRIGSTPLRQWMSSNLPGDWSSSISAVA